MPKSSAYLRHMSQDVSESLRESFFTRNSAGNFVALLSGAVAAILLLKSSGADNFKLITVVFSIALTLTILLFIVVRAQKKPYGFGWGLPVFIVLGFGLAAIAYAYRSWMRWLWDRILKINEPYEWALTALFLIGVMLGAFIVRIWPKDQDAFIKGLSGILGGTFVAAVFVKMFEDAPHMSQRAFALYALGFAISGTINLIWAAWLIADYTNKGSIRSRAVLDFLYGSERAETIDKYFLKNFEEDPDYAKRWLTNTLIEFSKLVQKEFAERLEQRRFERQNPHKKWHYYELISFKHEPHRKKGDDADEGRKEPQHRIIYRRLDDREPSTHSESDSPVGDIIKAGMFRVAVSIRQGDFLEYIVAPGEYRAPFPKSGSVAALSLEMRQTIVMDRDKYRKFRNKDHKDGISPEEREQPRGLDELNFLSYVCIPIVSRLGEASENDLGILNVDTKIFCSENRDWEKTATKEDGVFSVRITRSDLTEMAQKLYEDNDRHVEYLESLARIITPVLELFARCKVGAAKNP